MKHRKPKADRKGQAIQIRVTDAQKAQLAAAAKKTGLGLSGWMLHLALTEAEALR